MEEVKPYALDSCLFTFMVVATAALIGLETSGLQIRDKDTVCRTADPDF